MPQVRRAVPEELPARQGLPEEQAVLQVPEAPEEPPQQAAASERREELVQQAAQGPRRPAAQRAAQERGQAELQALQAA